MLCVLVMGNFEFEWDLVQSAFMFSALQLEPVFKNEQDESRTPPTDC